MTPRYCERCGEPLPDTATARRRFCSRRCKATAARRRQGQRSRAALFYEARRRRAEAEANPPSPEQVMAECRAAWEAATGRRWPAWRPRMPGDETRPSTTRKESTDEQHPE